MFIQESQTNSPGLTTLARTPHQSHGPPSRQEFEQQIDPQLLANKLDDLTNLEEGKVFFGNLSPDVLSPSPCNNIIGLNFDDSSGSQTPISQGHLGHGTPLQNIKNFTPTQQSPQPLENGHYESLLMAVQALELHLSNLRK